MPGEVVARQSTRTTLTCVAHGGETGGTATFSIENGDTLIACSGGSLPVTRFVPPQQKVEFEIDYEGKLPSGGERDIIAKADFTERGTGTRHSTQRDWLTSVKVELEADQNAPDPTASNFRHKYGVLEQVNFRHLPLSATVTWEFSAGGDLISKVGDHFFCTPRGSHGTAEVSAGGVSYTTDFDVLEPQIIATNATANAGGGVSPVEGESGHLLLCLDLYATPFYVSFKGLNIQEVPDESQSGPHSGYYNDQTKGGPWSHVAGEHMAGRWNEVDATGYFGTDRAGRSGRYDPPWIQGSKTWPIPMAWSPTPNDYFMQMFSPNPTMQHYEISSNGTFRIEKFNHWAERPISGAIVVDGVAIH